MEEFEKQNEIQKSGTEEGAIKKRIKKVKAKKQKVKKEPVQDCSICYNVIVDKGIIQTCQHCYCFQCIELWAKQHQTCPQCRVQFSQILRVWKQGKVKKQRMYDYHANEVNSDDEDLISLNFFYPIQMHIFQRFLSFPFANDIIIISDSE